MIEKDFDIFTISETWLNSLVTDVEEEIPGFNIYRLDRTNKLGRGVCAFVKQSYKVECLSELSSISPSGLHQLWLTIQTGKHKSFIICIVYRPPDTTLNCFDADLSETLLSALYLNKDIYILGDLNCNVLNKLDPGSRMLLNFCSAFNLTQVINQPMKITELSETLIDVILVSNTKAILEAGVMPVSISDHDLVYVVLCLKKSRPKPIYITTRSFKHYDRDAFLGYLSMVPWSVIDSFEDIDEKLNAFHLLFNPILEKHAPIKQVKLRGRPNPCVTDEIRALMKTRDKWRKLARRTNDPLAWSGYRNFKREV